MVLSPCGGIVRRVCVRDRICSLLGAVGPVALALLLVSLIYQEGHAYSRSWYLAAIFGSIAGIIVLIVLLIVIILNIFKKRYTSSFSATLGVLVALTLIYCYKSFFFLIDYAMLGITKQHYKALAGGKRAAFFEWGRTWRASDKVYFLVYDEEGEIRRATQTMSPLFRIELASKVPGSFSTGCDLAVTHIRGNFYVISNAACPDLDADQR